MYPTTTECDFIELDAKVLTGMTSRRVQTIPCDSLGRSVVLMNLGEVHSALSFGRTE